ncbi:MAG: Cytochrome P450 [Ktedonobacterales bacterium]|jgi:cytochrome P450|nr:MAG: Cytochrome P450 [Ktedonobacterales bacterium]
MPAELTSAPVSERETHSTTGRCPIDHHPYAVQKTARTSEPVGVPILRDAEGVWHVRGHEEARAILRSPDTKQSGFKAELIERLPRAMNLPILYQEGKPHQQQRKQTARFFTPKAVSANYRRLMETLSDQFVADLQSARRADLSRLSLALAVRVAAEIIGLTNSRRPGMEKRLAVFFAMEPGDLSWRPSALLRYLRGQTQIAAFYLLDVRPAIKARRRQPREDVISHLIAQGYRDSEILTECVTYGAAGMITTREFISVATWHLLEQPALRARYLVAPEAERHAMLEEILRLEPVVGHLYRRATADLQIESNGGQVTIAEGDLIDVHIYAVNADEAVVGEQPLALCPGRELHADRVAPSVMGFGDGQHRCPGSYVAIQETDIFLRLLLALDGLRIECAPTLSWNELVTGYELRDFMLALD